MRKANIKKFSLATIANAVSNFDLPAAHLLESLGVFGFDSIILRASQKGGDGQHQPT
ncbi:MAG: hypothetical protein M3367_06500 [Acidobacteriota bacterium]|nr:hypothetical protein [Acidobacteriota bacterium]